MGLGGWLKKKAKKVAHIAANPIDAGLSAVGLGNPLADAAGKIFGGNDVEAPQMGDTGEGDVNAALSEFEGLSRDYAGRMADIAKNPDQEMADRYFGQLNQPIQTEFAQGANQVSQYLSRQGLGSSGINVAAHSGLASNAAALESQAKKQALDMAVENERRGLLDAFSTRATALSPRLQKYGIDVSKVIAQMNMEAQMKMLSEQMNAQMFSGLGNIAGMAIGAGILSDGVAKTNVQYTGEDVLDGRVPVVTWEYKGMPGIRFRGVIAEDLEEFAPEYVLGDEYFKTVDYGFLDNG